MVSMLSRLITLITLDILSSWTSFMCCLSAGGTVVVQQLSALWMGHVMCCQTGAMSHRLLTNRMVVLLPVCMKRESLTIELTSSC